jgi:RNase H-like domain found in reverse transcriptase
VPFVVESLSIGICLFRQRSTILAPITKISSKNVPFVWGAEQQSAFEQMKALIAEDILLQYPDPNQPFSIPPDASEYQLGSAIKQNNRPVAYYSCKLTTTQQRYTTIEKELLSIVETLRAFRSFLFHNQHLHRSQKTSPSTSTTLITAYSAGVSSLKTSNLPFIISLVLTTLKQMDSHDFKHFLLRLGRKISLTTIISFISSNI